VNTILSKKASADFFNINDLHFLLDICLTNIERQRDPETRVQILKAIENILDNSMFKNYPYKVDDIY